MSESDQTRPDDTRPRHRPRRTTSPQTGSFPFSAARFNPIRLYPILFALELELYLDYACYAFRFRTQQNLRE